MAGGVDVQHAPHVAVVAVGVHADAAVGVAAAVLAPQPVLRAGVLVPVGVDHRGHPHLAPLQPAAHRVGGGAVDQVLGEPVRHLHRDPFPGVMAAQDRHLVRAAAALADPQRPQRPVLHAPADLAQLHDLRVVQRQPPQILLQCLHGVVAGGGPGGGEVGQIGVGHLQLLDVVAHHLQSSDLGLVGLHHQVIRPHLPHVQPQRRGEQPPQRCPCTGRRHARDHARHLFPRQPLGRMFCRREGSRVPSRGGRGRSAVNPTAPATPTTLAVGRGTR